jgi:hypothetical protein
LDCACESAALCVLEDDGEVGAVEHGGVAVDVFDGELDGGPGGPSDDGVKGEEGADGDVGRASRRRLHGDLQDGAEAKQTEEGGGGGGGGGRHHLTSSPDLLLQKKWERAGACLRLHLYYLYTYIIKEQCKLVDWTITPACIASVHLLWEEGPREQQASTD